jgi:hypothetical protein
MTYAATRSRAEEMLAAKGQTVTLTYVGTSVYDPATGGTVNTAPDPESVAGVILPLSAIRYAFRANGSTIIEGDQQLLLSALNTAGDAIPAPQVNGTIIDAAAQAWTLITVDPLSPASTAVLFDCVVRRAA